MPKEKKPGWRYFKSVEFDEEFAIHEKTGWVYFEKGAKYSPAEIKLMTDNGATIDLATHKVKTIIGGELVGYERTGTDDKGKSVAGGNGNNKPNDPDSGSKIPGITGNGENNESELLEIY